jgi:hypothetical protein
MDVMNSRRLACLLLATVCIFFLLAVPQMTNAAALEDQLPDTTGLFFGKRGLHPNMNNLLFGRRSSMASSAAAGAGPAGRPPMALERLNEQEARNVCRAIRDTCSKLALDDEEEQQ